jgi:hypothetical protein
LADQITCIQCHATALEKMNWNRKAKRQLVEIIDKWDTVDTNSGSINIQILSVDTYSYPLCFTRISGDTLYKADLTLIPRLVPGEKDSIRVDYDSIYFFRFDSSYDSSVHLPGEPAAVVEVNVFQEPIAYNVCGFLYNDSAIFEVVYDAKSGGQAQGTAFRDSIITRPEINRRFLLTPNENNTQSMELTLMPPESTFLGDMPHADRAPYLSEINGVQYALVHFDTTWRIIGNRVWISGDTITAQLTGDTLFYLFPDSEIVFGDNIFAEVNSNHMNGKVDISFLHERQTEYRADTLEALMDSLTGNVTGYKIKVTGIWRPERASCGGVGLNPDLCHVPVGETYWYIPDNALTGKGKK